MAQNQPENADFGPEASDFGETKDDTIEEGAEQSPAAAVQGRNDNQARAKKLQRSRSVIKGQITAKKNVLLKLMETTTDFKGVETVLAKYQALVDKFVACHEDYQSLLTDKQREDDQPYCDVRMENYEEFQAVVEGWIESMVESEDDITVLEKTSSPRGKLGYLDPKVEPFTPRTLPIGDTVDLSRATETALSAIAETQRDLTKQMKIPKSEPEVFDGDETKFQEFLTDFQEYVAKWADSDRERLTQLRAFTSGTPHQLVRGCIHLPPESGYTEALSLLQTRYGAPYDTSRAYVRKIRDWPKMNMKSGEQLDKFAILLRDSYNALTGLGRLTELEHPSTMSEIVEKLPDCLRYKWIRQDTEIYSRTGNPSCYRDLVKFAEYQAKVILNPRYSNDGKKRDSGEKPQGKQQGQTRKPPLQSNNSKPAFKTQATERNQASEGNQSRTQATERNQASEGNQSRAPATERNQAKERNQSRAQMSENCSYPGCKAQHHIKDCAKLKALPWEERRDVLKRQGRCYRCYERGHLAKDCEVKSEHVKKSNTTENSGKLEKSENTETLNSRRVGTNEAVTMAVLPVKLRSRDNGVEIVTNCFLDNGAGASFITDGLAKRMGLRGQPTTVELSTMLETCSSNPCRKIRNLEVKGLDPGDEWVRLHELYTHESVLINDSEIPTKNDVKKYLQLKNVNLKAVDEPVGLLLGANEPDAIRPVEIIPTKNDGPYAIRTKLGWTLSGPVQRGRSTIGVKPVHRITVTELNQSLNKHFSREFNDGPEGEEILQSPEEERFMKKLAENTRYTGERYEVKVPLKEDLPPIPNSRPMAERRLNGVVRRMKRDSRFEREYQKEIERLKEQSFIERVPENELEITERWYLPHHGVMNRNKNSKLRIVFDGSAKQDGISINDLLMKGPDLTNRLDGVMLRFREFPVAVCSDIKGMFHQIKIPTEDRNWYRFLWMDEQGNIEDWRWTVHPFGSKPSPAIACHVLNRCLEEQANPDVKDLSLEARNTFYVDDHFDSSIDSKIAERKIQVVDQSCMKSGLQLCGWASNCPKILKGIPEGRIADLTADISLGKDVAELPTLGMKWKPDRDKITYRAPELKEVTNRRELLSNMTKLFDPLGLVSPWILNCRLLVQELSRMKLTWDEQIPEEYLKKWKAWRDGTKAVTEIEFDRCVTSYTAEPGMTYQLHVFSDSSQTGHGVAAYIRTESTERVEARLVYARSRVNPMKGETIPRAELVAATLGAKTTAKLKRELRLPLQKAVNWTDSTLVLGYLKNESIKTSVFVRNRVGTILTHTSVADWKHVPGKENPADIASRGGSVKDLEGKLWQNGPEYLVKTEGSWPSEPVEVPKGHTSVKRTQIAETDPSEQACKTIAVLNRISEWERILTFAETIQTAAGIEGESSAENRTQARLAVIRVIQQKHYGKELERLRRKETVYKSSTLRKLCPQIDENGIMRVGGRLNDSLLPHEGKHPIILPGGEQLVRKLIRRMHCIEGHIGRNHVIASLRKEYWITGVTKAVRKVLGECVLCKKYQARRETQKMGVLPKDRVCATRAFENAGVDYFGPLRVQVGRHEEKRYGVLFSCNYTRAVHLEVARRLDTQSCLMAISRFINRRGRPRKLRSDNGTNLVGSCKEMKQELMKMNKELLIGQRLAKEEIEWSFHTPQASHMAGHYERQIRSVRKILYGLVNKQTLTDEELETVMVKCEWIMNSRPLTTTSGEDASIVAITPNHLMGLTTVETDVTLTNEKDQYRGRWKRVNYITEQVWKQFHNEYIVMLQQRQKWQEEKVNLKENDIVIVQDNSLGRAYWPVGRIITVEPSRDGQVRSCVVRTQTGTYSRPITKLVKLMDSDCCAGDVSVDRQGH